MSRKRPPDASRTRDLAIIHLGAKELGWDRELYEQVLWTVCRVRSAGDLDHAGRQAMIEHLRKVGFRAKRGKRANEWAWVDRAAESKRPMLRKIIMLARSRGKAYVDAMATRMFHVERLEFAAEDQLHAIIAALQIDQRRHEAAR